MSIRTTDTLDGGRIIFREPEPGEDQESRAQQVSDPVCGMDVDASSSDAEKLEHDGTTYYFCSRDCKAKFEEDPEEFITAV